MFEVDCGCGYGRLSTINPSLLDETNVSAYEGFKLALQTKSGVSKEVFERRLATLQRAVNRHKSRRTLSTMFKGKWIEAILSAELDRKFKGKIVDFHIVGPRLSSVATTLFDFSSDWASRHIDRLSNLFSQVF